MGQKRARPIPSQNPSQIAIGIFDQGRDREPVEVLREPVPEGFPPDLIHHLADYMARAYNAALGLSDGIDLSGMIETRGRPIDPQVDEIGRKAAMLRKQNPRFSWQKIALKLCPKKGQASHRCGKRYADRIRQAAAGYLLRVDLEKLARGE